MGEAEASCVRVSQIRFDSTCSQGAHRWLDTECRHLRASSSGTHVQLYSAFNMNCLVLVATVPSPDAPCVAPVNAAPEGSRVRHEIGSFTREFTQQGHKGDVDNQPLLYSVRFKVPDEWVDEFDRWYEEEHLPLIYQCRYWSFSRRYLLRQSGPEAHTHLALHYLSDVRGLDSTALRGARTTPWRKRFLDQDWFTGVEKQIHLRVESVV